MNSCEEFAGWLPEQRGMQTVDRRSVGANTLFKLENRNRTKWYRSQIGQRLRGKSENAYSGTRTSCLFDREKSQKVRVPEYTIFTFAPQSPSNLASIPFRPISIFQRKKRLSSGLSVGQLPVAKSPRPGWRHLAVNAMGKQSEDDQYMVASATAGDIIKSAAA